MRISSKKTFTHGLFIADVQHMPGNECGVWPAFWMFGPNWPNSGEIDIIEGVSLQATNVMTLHTGDTCTIAGTQSLGTLQTNDCNQNNGYGCSISSGSSTSYGDAFNSVNGGVYATQWTSDYIRIWYFPRSSIPADITSGQPDPANWGLPDGNFQGSCDIDENFANHQIVFDTTFCGDWAGSVWSSDPVCSLKASTCVDYVAGNPSAFADAYWDINYVKVFTLAEEPTATSTLAASSSTSRPILGTSIATTISISTAITLGPGSSPTTLPSSVSSATFPPFPISSQNATLLRTPLIQGWTYIGCLSSSALNIPTFVLSATNENMTVTLCASTCSTSAYLGTFGTSCYCGSDITGTTTLSNSSCSVSCPGSPSEACGGLQFNLGISRRSGLQHQDRHLDQPAGLEKRQSTGFFLTVYQNVLLLPDSPVSSSSPTADPSEVHFSPSTGGIPTPSISLTPVSTLIGVPMGGGETDSGTSTSNLGRVQFAPVGTSTALGTSGSRAQETTITVVLTTTYTDLCSCAASTLQVYTTTSTLIYTDCGCKTSTAPALLKTAHEIPMTTMTRICADCGMDGTVIVTVPCASSTSTPTPTSSAAPALKVIPTQNDVQVFITTIQKISIAAVATISPAALIEHPKSVSVITNARVQTVTGVAPQYASASVAVVVNGSSYSRGNQTFVLSNTGEGLRWRRWGLCVVLGLVGVGVFVH